MRKNKVSFKQILLKNGKLIFLILLLIAILNVIKVVCPYVFRSILDGYLIKDTTVSISLGTLLIAYIALQFATPIFEYIKDLTVSKTTRNVIQQVRDTLFGILIRYKMTTYQKYTSSNLYTRMTYDVNDMSELFGSTVPKILSNVVYVLGMIVVMLGIDVTLGILGIGIMIVLGVISFFFVKKLNVCNNNILKQTDQINLQYSEFYNSHKLNYIFDLENRNAEKQEALYNKKLAFREKYIFINTFFRPVVTLVEAMAIFLIVHFSLNLDISLGTIYIFAYYIQECFKPLRQIAQDFEKIGSAMISVKRVNELFQNKEQEENIFQGEEIENITGDIVFEQVSFKYEEEYILKDVNLILKQGTKVAIAGKTGAGKTTLINLLMKTYEPKEGRITIGGKDIKRIASNSIRKNISYISQDTYIFEDSIRKNIILNSSEITDEMIQTVIHEMGVESIFEKLENGLDEKINTSRMSKGELQIIAFIRAIVHKANIYIFDEPTSNIDLKTEKMIQDMINKIAETKTVIIIAHRKATIKDAEKLIYLKDGKVDIIINKKKQEDLITI